MKSVLFESAMQYWKQGYSIIPVNRNKKPYVPWQQYQEEKASEEQIVKWWKEYPQANIGIVTGVISNLAVIDIDTDEGKQAVQEYISDSLIMPVANTPSGGQHLYFKCSDKYLTNNAKIVPGCDLRANGGYIIAPPSNNGNGGKYTWQTDLSIHDIDLPDMPQAYLSYIKKSFMYSKQNNNSPLESTTSTEVHKLFTQGRRDNDLFHVANCLIKGGANENIARQVLELLANNCTPPFSSHEMNNKIVSAINRTEHKQKVLSDDVRAWVMSTTGHFMSTDVHNSLQLSTRLDKKNVSEILRRLCVENIIERHGNKHGCFRKIDDIAEDINFLNADVTQIKIKLPFDLHTLVNIYPRNIITVAGAPDSGKTAFLLNVVEMNMREHKIFYFSSEMGEQEMRLRLSKFSRDIKSWKFHPKERVGNFADVIRPDAVNIIDYLEVHEDFWRVGGMLKEIYSKLDKGIAIVAIQKDKHKEYGLGGTRGLEKPRLYVTMNPNQIKIEKAKNWANPLKNPNGLMLKFKLFQGCKFIITNDWHK